jgi:hypothetical protein
MKAIASDMNIPSAVASALQEKKFMVMSSKGLIQANVLLVYADQSRRTRVCMVNEQQSPMKEIKLFSGIPFVDESTAHQPGWFMRKEKSTYESAKMFNRENTHVQIKEIWRRVGENEFTVSYV